MSKLNPFWCTVFRSTAMSNTVCGTSRINRHRLSHTVDTSPHYYTQLLMLSIGGDENVILWVLYWLELQNR